MTALTEEKVRGDIIRYLPDDRFNVEQRTVLDGQTLVAGSVTQQNAASKAIKVVAGVDDVQTMTFQAGADGGVFALSYKGKAIALQAYNVSAADLQTAVRALHADLVACVVTTVGGVGVDYVITTPKMNATDITIAADGILDAAVAEPASIVHTTQGSLNGGLADGVCLETCAPSGADGKAMFLVRGPAIVTLANLSLNSCTSANVQAALKALGILCQ